MDDAKAGTKAAASGQTPAEEKSSAGSAPDPKPQPKPAPAVRGIRWSRTNATYPILRKDYTGKRTPYDFSKPPTK